MTAPQRFGVVAIKIQWVWHSSPESSSRQLCILAQRLAGTRTNKQPDNREKKVLKGSKFMWYVITPLPAYKGDNSKLINSGVAGVSVLAGRCFQHMAVHASEQHCCNVAFQVQVRTQTAGNIQLFKSDLSGQRRTWVEQRWLHFS